MRAAAVFFVISLGACSALPTPPTRPVLYDLGPHTPAAPAGQVALAPLALETVDYTSLPESASALYYRLAYADAQQLRPYQLARWSQPPQALVRESLQAHLGMRRAVLGTQGALAGARYQGQPPRVLRAELEEFSQVFESPEASVGLVRLRATLTQPSVVGEELLVQKVFEQRIPATSQDAAGGARALAQATAQAAQAVAQWLEQAGY